MKKWPSTKIDDICIRIAMGPFGSNIKVDNFVQSGVPVLNGANLAGFKLKEDTFNYVTEGKAEELKNSLAYRGDIVVTHRGTLGQLVYIPADSKFDKYVISQSQFLLRVDSNKADERFITYFFHSAYGRYLLLSNASQVGVPALARPTSTFKSLEIPLPPLQIQKKIADFLCLLDDKIENNTKINQNLEVQAQAIFKSWFVDFEPFQVGKVVDSEFGLIPEGWSVVTLNEIARLNNEKIPVIAAKVDTYISTENMLPNRGGIEIASNTPDRGTVTSFRVNDILISNIRPYFKKIWYASFAGSCSTDVLCFRAKSNIKSEFLFCILNTESFFSYIMLGAKGTKMPRGDKQQMLSYRVVLPTKQAIDNFTNMVKPIFEQQRCNNEESSRLAALRDTLLPKLMSGEIDVSEVEV